MPSGSDALFYWLDAERFAPFLNFPRQLPVELWHELQLNWDPTRLHEEQPGDKYSFWAEGLLSDEEQDLIYDLREGLWDFAVDVAGLGKWRADISGCLGYLFNNGLPSDPPLPERFHAPLMQFKQIFDRQIYPLPPWLDQVYNPGGFYAGLLSAEAVTELLANVLDTGLLEWLAEQYAAAETAKPGSGWVLYGDDLLQLKAFLAGRPAGAVWLLASEPFG
jgi:hypothetical protein